MWQLFFILSGLHVAPSHAGRPQPPCRAMSALLHTFIFKYASYYPGDENTLRLEERHIDTASELGFPLTGSFPNASHTFCRVLEGQQDAVTVPAWSLESSRTHTCGTALVFRGARTIYWKKLSEPGHLRRRDRKFAQGGENPRRCSRYWNATVFSSWKHQRCNNVGKWWDLTFHCTSTIVTLYRKLNARRAFLSNMSP